MLALNQTNYLHPNRSTNLNNTTNNQSPMIEHQEDGREDRHPRQRRAQDHEVRHALQMKPDNIVNEINNDQHIFGGDGAREPFAAANQNVRPQV